jgi:hypothetical protein
MQSFKYICKFTNQPTTTGDTFHSITVHSAPKTIIYQNDKRYQLDATIVIYYHELSLHVLGICMPIFRSTGCTLLHMVFSTRCCSCGPKEPVDA